MLVRTADQISFFRDLICRYTDKLERNKLSYEKFKIEYENKFFSRLFNLKFEKTITHYDWTFYEEYHIIRYEDEMKKLDYAHKMKYTVCELDSSYETAFFDYAHRNKLPY